MDTPRGHAQASLLKGRDRPGGIVFAALLPITLAVFGALAQAQDDKALPLFLTSEFRSVPAEKAHVFFAMPDVAPELDGRLVENAWTKRSPVPLGPDMCEGTASRKSNARIYHDEETLYVGFDCHEPALDSFPVAGELVNDRRSLENFRVCIAPDGASNHTAVFAVDPNGARYDWNSAEGIAWNPEWRAHVVREKDVWRGELAIPFEALGVETVKSGTAWRFNLSRHVAATDEECSWRPTDGNPRNRLLWGILFFGKPLDWKGLRMPPVIEIAPDRWELGASDYALRLALRIRATALPETASLRVEVLQAAEPSGDADPPPRQPNRARSPREPFRPRATARIWSSMPGRCPPASSR